MEAVSEITERGVPLAARAALVAAAKKSFDWIVGSASAPTLSSFALATYRRYQMEIVPIRTGGASR